jgi:hypothetical protein
LRVAHHSKAAQQLSPPAVSRRVAQPLSMHASSLAISDLRFFQHFLISAFPPLPVGGRHVWQYISQMSHEVWNHDMSSNTLKQARFVQK